MEIWLRLETLCGSRFICSLRTTFATNLLKEVHIPHQYATVDCFAHIVDCEQGDLDCGEKLNKNKELRKT
jgi:hypothetical protein